MNNVINASFAPLKDRVRTAIIEWLYSANTSGTNHAKVENK